MSDSGLERIEGLLKEIMAELRERGATPMPTLLTLKAAAGQLSIGMTKLRELVNAQVVMTTELGGRQMVPASEIARLSQVDRPRLTLTPKAQRLADSLKKVREPIAGAKEAAISVRNAKRPRATQLQDFSQLDALLKSKPKKPTKPRA